MKPARLSHRVFALAVRHGGCFVSFDSAIPLTAIRRAEQAHIVTL